MNITLLNENVLSLLNNDFNIDNFIGDITDSEARMINLVFQRKNGVLVNKELPNITLLMDMIANAGNSPLIEKKLSEPDEYGNYKKAYVLKDNDPEVNSLVNSNMGDGSVNLQVSKTTIEIETNDGFEPLLTPGETGVTGTGSLVAGYGNFVDSPAAFAFGHRNKITEGMSAVSFVSGCNNEILGASRASVAFGITNYIENAYAGFIAGGKNNELTGSLNFISGLDNSVDSTKAYILGEANSITQGNNNVILGTNNIAQYTESVSLIGSNNIAENTITGCAIGNDLILGENDNIAIGRFNIDKTNAIVFGIGNPTDGRMNGLEIDYTTGLVRAPQSIITTIDTDDKNLTTKEYVVSKINEAVINSSSNVTNITDLADVSNGGEMNPPTPDSVLTFDGSQWTANTIIPLITNSGLNITDLADVSNGGEMNPPTPDSVLTFDGSQWTANTFDQMAINSTVVASINDNDVGPTETWSSSKISDEILINVDNIINDNDIGPTETWSSSKISDEITNAVSGSSSSVSSFQDLSDVDFSTGMPLDAYDILYYDGTNWVNYNVTEFVGTMVDLNSLADVNTTLISEGDLFGYLDGAWRNLATTDIIIDDDSSVDNKTYSSAKIDSLISAGGSGGLDLVDTLPVATLSELKKFVYAIDESKFYCCVANTTNPTSDDEVFWVEI